MGYSFSNLQVRNEDGRIQPEQVLDVLLAGQRLTQAEQADRADVLIAVGAKAGSPWLTVVSDLFDEDPEKSVSLARELSGKLGTAVLAVSGLDSEYLFLNLHDAAHHVDAWASCGRFPEGKAPRRSNFAAWAGYAADAAAMRAVMKKPCVFAEECLEGLAPILSIPVSQSGCCPESAEGDPDFRCFYYRSDEENHDLPRFALDLDMTAGSYGFGTPCLLSFINLGGASRGVAVCVRGECVAQKQVEFEYMKLQMHDARGEWVFVPVRLREETEGRTLKWLYAELPDVRIPKAVPDSLPPKKKMQTGFLRHIGVRFQLRRTYRTGDEPGSLQISLIPLANRSGQCGRVLAPPGGEMLFTVKEEERNE